MLEIKNSCINESFDQFKFHWTTNDEQPSFRAVFIVWDACFCCKFQKNCFSSKIKIQVRCTCTCIYNDAKLAIIKGTRSFAWMLLCYKLFLKPTLFRLHSYDIRVVRKSLHRVMMDKVLFCCTHVLFSVLK